MTCRHFFTSAATLLMITLSVHAASPAREDFQLARQWIAAARTTVPFSFRYGDRSSRELLSHWKVSTARHSTATGVIERHWTYRDQATGLEVEWILTEYSAFPAFEWVLYFRNTSDKDTPILENILPLDAAILGGPAATAPRLEYARGSQDQAQDFEPLSQSLPQGEPARFTPRGGRSSDGYLPFFQISSPNGANATLGIGWTGQWAAAFTNQGSHGVTATAGMERTHFRLHPGESVRTPAILLEFWKGNDPDRGRNLWRSLLLSHYTPRQDGHAPKLPVALSVHLVYAFEKTDEANMLDAATYATANHAGWDTLWIDAGWLTLMKNDWAKSVGNIEADPARFPHGLAPIAEAVHRGGMRFLAWLEPERVITETWLARNHPDWLLPSLTDKDNRLLRNRTRLLDLCNPDVLAWLVDWAGNQIARSGIDIYRQDFNMAPLDFWRSGEADDRQGIREIRHVTNLYAYWDALRHRFPGLLIDNCASGGRRIDFETLRRSVILWRTDRVWDNLAGTQAISYGLSRWIPVHALGAITTEPYDFRSGLGAAASFPLDFHSPRTAAAARDALKQYRSIQPLYQGDYYPLTAWSLKPDVWMAWQYNQPESGAGFVQAFRREQSPSASATYKLRGLDPHAIYSITDWDHPGERRLTGEQLSRDGIEIRLPAARSAAVLEYRRINPVQ